MELSQSGLAHTALTPEEYAVRAILRLGSNRHSAAADAKKSLVNTWSASGMDVLAELKVPENVRNEAFSRILENIILPFVNKKSSTENTLSLHQTIQAVSQHVNDNPDIFVQFTLLALISTQCRRAELWINDADMLHAAHADAVEFGQEYMVLMDRESLVVHEYLRKVDPRGNIKFVIMLSADTKQWRIVSVDYPGKRFAPYVPLKFGKTVCQSTFFGAQEMVEDALERYYQIENIPNRLARWFGMS